MSMFDQEWFEHYALSLFNSGYENVQKQLLHWMQQTCKQRAVVDIIVKAQDPVSGDSYREEEEQILENFENCYKLCKMIKEKL